MDPNAATPDDLSAEEAGDAPVPDDRAVASEGDEPDAETRPEEPGPDGSSGIPAGGAAAAAAAAVSGPRRAELEQRVLDALWDFSAPAVSEERFREAADDDAYSARMRSVLATQLARALGLRGRFEEGEAVLATIEAGPAASTGDHQLVDGVDSETRAAELGAEAELRARVALERGRLLASSGRPAEAVPHFTRAVRESAIAGSTFLALDALHMLALADVGHEEEWAEEALEVLQGTRDARALRWGVAVNNNLGWTLHDSDRADEALERFTAASTYAERFGTPEQRHIARWSIARCLRSLGRDEEALAIQRELVVSRPDDPYVHQELAELGEPAVPPASGDAPTIET